LPLFFFQRRQRQQERSVTEKFQNLPANAAPTGIQFVREMSVFRLVRGANVDLKSVELNQKLPMHDTAGRTVEAVAKNTDHLQQYTSAATSGASVYVLSFVGNAGDVDCTAIRLVLQKAVRQGISIRDFHEVFSDNLAVDYSDTTGRQFATPAKKAFCQFECRRAGAASPDDV
jgi:hypothetical protein